MAKVARMTDHAIHPDLKIAVVNLDRHADRWARVAASAQAVGLGDGVARFSGFDGSHRPEADLAALVPPVGYAGPLSPKDRGCTASHLLLMRDFLAGDARVLLALEDDITLTEDMLPWISDLGWMPEGADLIRLEAWNDPMRYHVIARHGPRHAGRDLRRLYSMCPGTAAYMITRPAAERLVALTGRADMPIDHLLFNTGASQFARNSQIWQVRPALVKQELPMGPGHARHAITRSAPQRLRDALARAHMDLGGAPRSLLPLLTRQRQLVRPL